MAVDRPQAAVEKFNTADIFIAFVAVGKAAFAKSISPKDIDISETFKTFGELIKNTIKHKEETPEATLSTVEKNFIKLDAKLAKVTEDATEAEKHNKELSEQLENILKQLNSPPSLRQNSPELATFLKNAPIAATNINELKTNIGEETLVINNINDFFTHFHHIFNGAFKAEKNNNITALKDMLRSIQGFDDKLENLANKLKNYQEKLAKGEITLDKALKEIQKVTPSFSSISLPKQTPT